MRRKTSGRRMVFNIVPYPMQGFGNLRNPEASHRTGLGAKCDGEAIATPYMSPIEHFLTHWTTAFLKIQLKQQCCNASMSFTALMLAKKLLVRLIDCGYPPQERERGERCQPIINPALTECRPLVQIKSSPAYRGSLRPSSHPLRLGVKALGQPNATVPHNAEEEKAITSELQTLVCIPMISVILESICGCLQRRGSRQWASF